MSTTDETAAHTSPDAPALLRVGLDAQAAFVPTYATAGSAGMDLRAHLSAPVVLAPGDRLLVPSGIRLALPVGYEAQVRPRSGLALKHGVTVLNAPGTVDADYRGDVGVILANFGAEPCTVSPGDRVAQLVVCRYERVSWTAFPEDTAETERGAGGFGSTGTV